jgi:uncharacterized damage-inducible protein DinB
MPNPAAALIAELDREAKATRKVLERVPAEKLEWRPHAKSMTLGQLANHVARIPGHISRVAQGEGMDAAKSAGPPPQPAPDTDFAATLDASLAESRAILSGMDDGPAHAPWTLTFGDREVFSIPRLQVLRTMLLNHWYHHRGQLTVYLRLLDVPVPAVYGRSADETTLGGHAD